MKILAEFDNENWVTALATAGENNGCEMKFGMIEARDDRRDDSTGNREGEIDDYLL